MHWDQVFCPFKRGCPLFRGYKYIGGMLKQAFGTTKSVLWMEVNCYSECPLLEVPLYFSVKLLVFVSKYND